MGGIIVLADTHFGIRKGSISMPGYCADFLHHITTMHHEEIQAYDGKIMKKVLESPEKVIFLGDIVELWDSQNEAVSFCMSSLLSEFSQMNADLIYVLGNHDNILDRALLSTSKEYYCCGKKNVFLFENCYPDEGIISAGDQKYVFVHGHQFDTCFRLTGKSYKILSHLRTVSNSLTCYVPFLFAISLICKGVNILLEKSIVLGDSRICILLFLLTLPWIYMTAGRRVWSFFSGVKYKKEETIKNFTSWWKKFTKDHELPDDINVVYGHTHYLNLLLQKEKVRNYEEIREFIDASVRGRADLGEESLFDFYDRTLKKARVAQKPTLVNVSAWIKDISEKEESEKYKSVMVASFLYIHEKGFDFFGWDWYEKKVFHIPKIAIIQRREQTHVDERVAGILREIGWPESLVKKWEQPFDLSWSFRKRVHSMVKRYLLSHNS